VPSSSPTVVQHGAVSLAIAIVVLAFHVAALAPNEPLRHRPGDGTPRVRGEATVTDLGAGVRGTALASIDAPP
jgi:hypothetical protein